MRRKLVKQGQNALTLTLPANWIKAKKLKAGDDVELEEKNQNIIVYRVGEAELSIKNITVQTNHRHQLRSIIASAYKAGFDEILLNFKTRPPLQEINKICNSFTGLEIISQDTNKITLKSFLKTEEKELENLIVKMLQSAKLIAETVHQRWGDVNLKNLRLSLLNLRKLRDHCLRTIHKCDFGGDKSYDYYDFVTQLEKVSNSFCHLAEYSVTNKPKRSDLVSKLILDLEKFYKIYLKKDFSLANKLWLEHRNEVKEAVNIQNLSKLLKEEDPEMVVYFYNINMQFRHLASRLVSLNS
ncbi:MAG: hypothetical protein ABIA37_00625 [Candidatus Woesearchaeota archaeon]